MEWACYTLPDDEQVEAEGSIRDAPLGTSLAAAHRTTCGGNTGMAGIQQVVTSVRLQQTHVRSTVV